MGFNSGFIGLTNSDVILIFWFCVSISKQKREKTPKPAFPSFFYFAYVANSKKTGVGCREMFTSGEGFHRPKSMDNTALSFAVLCLQCRSLALLILDGN